MAKHLRLKITHQAEIFLNELAKEGIDERNAIAMGLGLLETVHRTGLVALMKPEAVRLGSIEKYIDRIFTLRSLLSRSNVQAEVMEAITQSVVDMISEPSKGAKEAVRSDPTTSPTTSSDPAASSGSIPNKPR